MKGRSLGRQKQPISKYGKALRLRDCAILGISILITLLMSILGVLTLTNKVSESTIGILFGSVFVLLLLMLIINVIASAIHKKRFNSKDRREQLQFIYSQREHAQQSSEKLIKKLHITLIATNVYTVIYALLSAALVFFAAPLGAFSPFGLISIGLIYGALARIHFPAPKELFTAENGYLNKEDYPELYAMAEEAKNALGVDGEIRIALLPDFNAGIRRFGDTISIQIGAALHNAMSREELKSILLHEFAHLKDNEYPTLALYNRNCWLTDGQQLPGSLVNVTNLFFRFFDGYFILNYILYQYASTIGTEERADSAMVKYGEARYAGSAFLKLKYYELYEWEKGTYDYASVYESEEPDINILRDELERFKKSTELRHDFWNRLIDVEIISRSATHPTIRMRLEAIGHTDYSIHESLDSEAYMSEQQKTVALIDGDIAKAHTDTYKDERAREYLAPLDVVTKWESEGSPLTPEGYRDIIIAYRDIGRVKAADELCDRVIAELPESANHYAYFIKGCTLLHSFDETGIDYIYRAIESNHNYIDEGMQTIGQFCCISGKQDELDTYRQRALELADDQDTKYSELQRITAKDTLVSDELPQEMRDGIVRLAASMESIVDEVYLVRKIITKEFFASAVIVQFKKDTDNEAKYNALHQFFLYLDAQDWQFTLFDASDVPMPLIKKIYSSLIYDSKDLSAHPWHGNTLKS